MAWAALLGKSLGVQAGVSENREAFGKFANGRGSEFVGLRHRARGVIGSEQVATLQFGASAAMTHLIHSGGDAVFHLDGRIVGEGMTEILHDIQLVSATNHAQPDHVVGRVKQVRAMRG